jgi:ATP-dependent Clp protease ATP-binding subunit ClpB
MMIEMATARTPLNPEQGSPRMREFEEKLSARIVGQERAVRSLARLYQVYLSGLTHPGRPIGTLLFLGPTGTGKTRVVAAAAEALFENPQAFIKIDCAEFQPGHEIARLIGSPPGYLGHRETHADAGEPESPPYAGGSVDFCALRRDRDSLRHALAIAARHSG